MSIFSDFFGTQATKESARLADIASQDEQSRQILNEYLAQLVPGSEEYNRFVTEAGALAAQTSAEGDQQGMIRALGSQLVQQQQARIAAGGPATAVEARTDQSYQGLRDVAAFTPEEQAVLNALRGISTTGGEGAGINDIFSQLVGRAKNPDQYFSSTFSPQLQLLQDQVKARAASRGTLGSGLELEDLGRAGVELAIKEAQQREAFRQDQLANFMGLFNLGQGFRSQEIGLEEGLVNLQQGRESRLTDILNSNTQARASDASSLLQRNTSRANDLFDTATAREQAIRDAALGAVGTAAGGAIGGALGGPAGAAIGSQTASGLLGSQQSQTSPQSMNPAGSLSRTGGSSIDLQTLLKLLQSSGAGAP